MIVWSGFHSAWYFPRHYIFFMINYNGDSFTSLSLHFPEPIWLEGSQEGLASLEFHFTESCAGGWLCRESVCKALMTAKTGLSREWTNETALITCSFPEPRSSRERRKEETLAITNRQQTRMNTLSIAMRSVSTVQRPLAPSTAVVLSLPNTATL